MSLADDIRSALVDDWQPDVTPPDPPWLTKVRELERRHAEAVRLLRKCDVALYDGIEEAGTRHLVDAFLADHDKREDQE